MGAKLGLAAKLYRLTTGTRASWGTADGNGFNSGAAPSNLDPLDNVQDLGWSVTDGESDISTRGNNGFVATLPAMSTLELHFNMVYDSADADFLALMKAKIAKTTIAAAALDGDKATSGVLGVWADWYVFTVQKTEDLQEGQKVDFTLKPGLTSVAPQYVAVP